MSQFNAPAYDVARPSWECALTGAALVPGEPYIATLIEEGDELIRKDVALSAWDAGERPENLFSFWRSVVPEPNEKKKLFVDDSVLMNLLERLADADQPQRLAFRFVLALILMRKKLVRYDRTESRPTDGTEGEPAERDWWVLTPKLDITKGPMSKWDDSRALVVLDPGLGEEGIRAVTDQLSDILQAEL